MWLSQCRGYSEVAATKYHVNRQSMGLHPPCSHAAADGNNDSSMLISMPYFRSIILAESLTSPVDQHMKNLLSLRLMPEKTALCASVCFFMWRSLPTTNVTGRFVMKLWIFFPPLLTLVPSKKETCSISVVLLSSRLSFINVQEREEYRIA